MIRYAGLIFAVFLVAVCAAYFLLKPQSPELAYLSQSEKLVKSAENLQRLDQQILEGNRQIENRQSLTALSAAEFSAQQSILVAGLATANLIDGIELSLFSGVGQQSEDLFHANALLSVMIEDLDQKKTEVSTTAKKAVQQSASLKIDPEKLTQQREKQIAEISEARKLQKSILPKLKPLLPKLGETRSVEELRAPDLGPAGDLSDLDMGIFTGLSPDEASAKVDGYFMARFPQKTGGLRQPAVGKRFTNAENTLVIRAPANATVVAPFDGVVEFVGPFRSFGPMVVLKHTSSANARETHSILYGLEYITVELGAPVLKGEPLGQMGSKTLTENRLYFELQFDKRRVDPLPWLELSKANTDG